MKINTKQIILVSLFAALTAVGAFIRIPLGTVPITLQFIFTALSGVMLGGRLGAISQLIYVVIGFFGVPVFAGGTGGPGVIFKPTFGYLIGFIIGAYVIGKIVEGSRRVNFYRLFIASIAGIIVIYAVGVPYLYLIVRNFVGKDITLMTALKTGFLIFIPGDLIKCTIVAALGARVLGARQIRYRK
jgi:biotin transport system substrate-specific component